MSSVWKYLHRCSRRHALKLAADRWLKSGHLTIWVILSTAVAPPSHAQQTPALRLQVQKLVDEQSANLFELYKHFHAHPELSFHEEQSAARLAEELRQVETIGLA